MDVSRAAAERSRMHRPAPAASSFFIANSGEVWR